MQSLKERVSESCHSNVPMPSFILGEDSCWVVISTPPATLRLIEETGTILAPKSHPPKHSDLCRLLRRIKHRTLSRFHSVIEIRKLIQGI